MNSNYSQQRWPVRAYRWLRYMPLAYVFATVDTIGWALNGFPQHGPAIPAHAPKWLRDKYTTKWRNLCIIWDCHRMEACHDMEAYVYLEHFIDELRAKNDTRV